MKSRKLLIAALSGVMALSVSLGAVGCAPETGGPVVDDAPPCEHSLTYAPHADSSCAEEGHIAHYTCSLCNKMFFDEKAEIELSAANVAIAKVNHSVSHHAATDKVVEYWDCFACGKYFTDSALTVETTRAAVLADYYDPIKCTDGRGNSLNMYHSTTAGGTLEPIAGDFTFRCFVSWVNEDGLGYDSLNAGDKLTVFINLNDQSTVTGSPRWYNFGVSYGKQSGLGYKKLESGEIEVAPKQFTDLFLEQGGIYVVVVRDGGSVSFYFEDGNGVPQRMGVGMHYGEDAQLVRLAANKQDIADGWTQSITKSAICIGVADANAIFDKAYAEN